MNCKMFSCVLGLVYFVKLCLVTLTTLSNGASVLLFSEISEMFCMFCLSIDRKGLFTYYVSQKWGGTDPPTPMSAKNQKLSYPPSPLLSEKNQKLANPPSPLVGNHISTHYN